ncbi:MAG: hypothetical protein AUI16_06025 [Alphaproteobacteria bacterium 13_2_20CM_2_64_7]|nr:MAG: hypothetical protein AUI16_06025 [Alphaproteobacteria bacterium 13_2_20CM_2_64_7]
MALDPKAQAALALYRFGLGPRAGSIAGIASDPRGALLAELDGAGAGRIGNADLLTSGTAARVAFAFQQAQREARQAERAAQQAAAPSGGASPPQMNDQSAPPPPAPVRNPGPGMPQQIYLAEAKARIQAALGAEIGFLERLVWFWSNHFCVSADKGNVRQICGAYEREVIRANVLGRFSDMLLAAESHPAMLIYLDNARSIGPDSIAGLRQKRGLNENLAREILELHTLGVRTVYTQEDVTRFANVITGWTFVPFRQDPVRGGEFEFNPRMHQPGAQTVIGRSYPDAGMQQGRDVLAALARHPATAKHVAAKLARHFVADEPPPALVERLAKRFLATQGDLKEVTKALVAAPEAWEAPRAKLKRPGEWVIGMLRAAGITPPDIGPVMQAHNLLGEPLWRPSAPKGFADESAPWLDGLAQRLDIANQFARRVGAEADPREVFEQALAPLASSETRQAVLRAESRPQALALMFMAPEFQRR